MTHRPRRLLWALLTGTACTVAACQGVGPEPTPARSSGPVGEGRALLEQGQLDAALARLQEAPDDPESLYLQGRVWARKAETAPLPTPPPAVGELPRGTSPPPAPEFKPEERQALDLFERAVAARPDLGLAHLAIAELLAPHATRRHDRQRELAAAAGRRRGKGQHALPETDAQGIDFGVERIIRSYDLAAQADETGRESADGLIAFGIRVGRLDAAESGFRHLLEKVKENADPLIRYGTFLLEHKKDGDAAIEQYRQALIWKPDDEATRLRIADIYLARGADHFAKQQFAVADSEFKLAARWVAPGSAQEQQLRRYQKRLLEIRMPAGRQ